MKYLYRAYDERHKTMEYIDDLYWFEENSVNEIDDLEVVKTTTGDYRFMRYIGFEDINGKKIYENDIVEIRYVEYPKRPPIVCAIWWLDYKASFRAVKSRNFTANICNTNKYRTKVIGNTYQDSKLWKDTEGITISYPQNKKQLEFAKRVEKR